MSNFVLVHGAMHGGWAWQSVARLLEKSGHQVYCPTLTGQGERNHLLNRSIGIETHINDIQNLLYFEDLSNVILVLHSYAGILAGPLAERCHARLKAVVFAGAFYSYPGESLLDIEPNEIARYYESQVREFGSGWYLPTSTKFLDLWGITNQALRDFIGPRLTSFPFKCQTDKVSYDPRFLKNLRKIYIDHTEPCLHSLDLSLKRAISDGFERYGIPTGHDMMLTDPTLTASLLDAIDRGEGITKK